MANIDWHKISASEIKNSTFQLGSQISKIELSSCYSSSNTVKHSARRCRGRRARWTHTYAPGASPHAGSGAAALQAPQGRSNPLYGGTSDPGARATGATDGWWWQHWRTLCLTVLEDTGSRGGSSIFEICDPGRNVGFLISEAEILCQSIFATAAPRSAAPV